MIRCDNCGEFIFMSGKVYFHDQSGMRACESWRRNHPRGYHVDSIPENKRAKPETIKTILNIYEV